jgi:hypothetical protein
MGTNRSAITMNPRFAIIGATIMMLPGDDAVSAAPLLTRQGSELRCTAK